MHELSLFTGAGGGIWGSKLLGWRTVGYVERDSYCQQVIRARIKDGIFDDAPIFNDVRTFDGIPYRGRVDCITAGFPCQPFSVAGKQRAHDDSANCWPDTIRIIREVQPRFCLLENVPGLVNTGYFGVILKDLALSGFDAKWKVISASELGAKHIRKRLWIFADSHRKSIREQQIGELAKQARELKANSGWSLESRMDRIAHGVANRGHRLKALGNGQVPIVAATAWKELNE